SEQQLAQRVNHRVEALKDINIYPSPIKNEINEKQIESNIAPEQFIKTVSDMKSLIQQGDMFQVVPSIIYKYKHQFGVNIQSLSYQLYQNLKRQNPSPYMYYLNLDEPIIVGSSPESFVKVKGQTVVTNPIAGTIKRGATEAEDYKNEQQLINDEKEISEHSMLVDLGRNDIHRESEIASSKIEKLMAIERYEHVMHIVSEITGKLKSNYSQMTVIASLLQTATVSGAPKLKAIERYEHIMHSVSEITGKLKSNYSPRTVIASLLPTGTVSGAPKLRAIQRIYEAQPQKRGVYSGGIGYINCNHDLDFALAIRT